MIPSAVKYLESEAFMENQTIQKVVIPEGVKRMGTSCFAYCFNLQQIVIPQSMEQIGQYAFSRLDGLETVTFQGDAPSMRDDAFFGTTAEIFYPAGNDTWNGKLYSYSGTLTWTAVEMGPCTHSETRLIPGVEAGCLETGLSAGQVCANCGVVVEEQKPVPALGHAWKGEACSRCGEQKPAGMMGDVDGNGKLTYNDALMVLRYSIKLASLENAHLADVDGNGKVDYNDALKILRLSINLA